VEGTTTTPQREGSQMRSAHSAGRGSVLATFQLVLVPITAKPKRKKTPESPSWLESLPVHPI
jgi:hypothetical protein